MITTIGGTIFVSVALLALALTGSPDSCRLSSRHATKRADSNATLQL
jgi:hypothetical protein